MNWVDLLILGTVNFVSVLVAVFLISAVSEARSNKRKAEFLEHMFGQVIEKAQTDNEFGKIVNWNFMTNEKDDNDKR